ncbi:hypothetical protein K432DRAFT_197450 [Lepidopterella palustris CBS 459.81]|uniref:Uncharacterized protein n=1 Tax=Lepidopterella palustris CBS 459.81 TaxID=1314670 RepID=A0A8E2EFU6_9PEZI|nr:hypothetical protein K432DRAFT_197450 [Lepidopterella palustris CBS 459.81]
MYLLDTTSAATGISGLKTMASDEQTTPPSEAAPTAFDDVFQATFMRLVDAHNEERRASGLTRKDRKKLIKIAHQMTEDALYPQCTELSPAQKQQKSLTKVLYHVMADEPWLDDWIRAPDVERKLSKFELHEDSEALAQQYGFQIPRDAIAAARHALNEDSTAPNAPNAVRVPFDLIEVIYIPGTVSSDATNAIDRKTIYPISVESVAFQLENHPCKDMTRPFDYAAAILHTTDRAALLRMKQQASDICDFAPHLLDNDNVSLLYVLLILTRSEVCKRFEENGIRVEGSTMSHRKSELMKHSLGWLTQEDKAGYDSASLDIQRRIKQLYSPSKTKGAKRGRKPGSGRKSMDVFMHESTMELVNGSLIESVNGSMIGSVNEGEA